MFYHWKFVIIMTKRMLHKQNLMGSTKNVTLLGGGKRAGKSTMLRYLVNKGLTNGPILVVDLDPGQSEFTVCGSISATVINKPLLGSNFTHLTKPIRSLCLGLINVADNEERYINSVKSLYEFCKNSDELSKMPWIINTMGYTTAAGYQLFTFLYYTFKPNAIIELMCSTIKSKNNFETPLKPEYLNKNKTSISHMIDTSQDPAHCSYYAIEPYMSLENNNAKSSHQYLEAKTERLLNILAYLSKIDCVNYNSILGVKPYIVSLDKINIAFNNLLVDYKYISMVLNGRIVALCSANLGDNIQGKLSKYGNEAYLCHGYGLIRGIDLETRDLYILTPENMDVLMQINTLVYGETLPDCCSVLSVHSLKPRSTVPYAAPLQEGLKHKHLLEIPKRKFNPFRLFDITKKHTK